MARLLSAAVPEAVFRCLYKLYRRLVPPAALVICQRSLAELMIPPLGSQIVLANVV
jgi:hypothetical protein